jgi:hypothetical protein
MPRPISWLPRLQDITRSVASSIRSHYDRHDLEMLFELQPRAAQKLLEMLPAVQVGTSRLIDRETLASFLDRVRDSEDTTLLFDQIRSEKAQISRRKVRSLVRRDVEPVSLDSLPPGLIFRPGHMEISFTTIEDLAQSMYLLARAIETDGDEMARRFELYEAPDQLDPERRDLQAITAELSRREQQTPHSPTPRQSPSAS